MFIVQVEAECKQAVFSPMLGNKIASIFPFHQVSTFSCLGSLAFWKIVAGISGQGNLPLAVCSLTLWSSNLVSELVVWWQRRHSLNCRKYERFDIQYRKELLYFNFFIYFCRIDAASLFKKISPSTQVLKVCGLSWEKSSNSQMEESLIFLGDFLHKGQYVLFSSCFSFRTQFSVS